MATDSGFDPRSIDGAFIHTDDLPRPQWDRITTVIDERVDECDRDAAWTEMAELWLNRLCDVYGSPYRYFATDNFLLLCGDSDRTARRIADHAEHSLATTLRYMPAAASDEGYGPHVILALRNREDYYRYTSHFDPPEGEFGETAGVMHRGEYNHISLNMTYADQVETVISHEIGHACLSARDLPMWIEEGAVQLIEAAIAGGHYQDIWRGHVDAQRAYWTEHGLDGFFSGASFYAADDGQHLSYALAWVIAYNLAIDQRDRYERFLIDVRSWDGGWTALRKHYGITPWQAVGRFLGDGPWNTANDPIA